MASWSVWSPGTTTSGASPTGCRTRPTPGSPPDGRTPAFHCSGAGPSGPALCRSGSGSKTQARAGKAGETPVAKGGKPLLQPVILIYGLADALAGARAAFALDLPVTLRVGADVAAGMGPDVIADLFAQVRAEVPGGRLTAMVDCADAPGLAIALLRRGIDRVGVDGPAEMLQGVAEIAAEHGAGLDEASREALDLLAADDAARACEHWLRGFKSASAKPNCE